MTELKIKLRYLKVEKSRHGKTRYYVRVPGRLKVRLLVEGADDTNFMTAYTAALNGEQWRPAVVAPKSPETVVKPVPGSFRALCVDYFAFLQKDPQIAPRTKYTRRRHLEEVCREPTKIGASYVMGDVPANRFGVAHVQAVLDRKIATPEAMNDRHKALSVLFKWAIARRRLSDNPAAIVPRTNTHSEGFTPWTKDDVAKFTRTHPIGTKAHLAMALLLYTGQRRADVVTFGRQMIEDGKLHFVQNKNHARMHKKMAIPIIPALQEVLDHVPRGQLTFLLTEFGKPFTAAGFGNWFRDRCNMAGLTGLSAHGLRKALQDMGANAGLSDRELMAIAGHESAKETSRYTKKRDRDLLAESGMAKLSAAHFENRIGPPKIGVPESGPIRIKKANEIKGA
jgi:integrase